MRAIVRLALLLSMVAPSMVAPQLRAQTNDPILYAESFRKGATHITEDKFQARLSPADAIYRERIKDAAGNDRYELTISPQGPVGDNKITSWRVQLRDLRYKMYPNLLVAEQQPSDDARNNLWWLNPNPFGPVPIRTRRVVKVDSFYVIFRVKDCTSRLWIRHISIPWSLTLS